MPGVIGSQRKVELRSQDLPVVQQDLRGYKPPFLNGHCKRFWWFRLFPKAFPCRPPPTTKVRDAGHHHRSAHGNHAKQGKDDHFRVANPDVQEDGCDHLVG
jgi:hypothetical protein